LYKYTHHEHGILLTNHALIHQVHRDLEGSLARALAPTALQHE
jgi:hypothetical protein